jgi:hypothetical protein
MTVVITQAGTLVVPGFEGVASWYPGWQAGSDGMYLHMRHRAFSYPIRNL